MQTFIHFVHFVSLQLDVTTNLSDLGPNVTIITVSFGRKEMWENIQIKIQFISLDATLARAKSTVVNTVVQKAMPIEVMALAYFSSSIL